jgi:autotransporter-associated beta strand protein
VAPTNAPASNYEYSVALTLRTPQTAGNYTTLANSVVVTSGGTFVFKGNGTNTVNNLILNGGEISQGETGANPDTATLAGSVNLVANATITSGATATYFPLTLVIQAPITNAPGSNSTLTLNDNSKAIGGLVVVLAAQNTFNGGITVAGFPGDTLKLSVNNALPATTSLIIQGTTGTSGTTNPVFDLNGCSTAISNLTFATSSNSGYVTNSAAGTTGTLTISNNAADTVQYGTIADNPATAGTVALVKTGTGKLTLAAANTYRGGTTVNAGTLALSSSGRSASLLVTNGATCQVLTTLGVLTNTATVAIGSGSLLNLTNGVNQTVGNLCLNGQWETAGTWGSSSSSAANKNNTYFSGAGMLTVSSSGQPLVIKSPVVVTSGSPTITPLFQTSNLTLSWPSYYTGWQLQVQTNGLLGSNWLDVPGTTITNQIIIPINPDNGAGFFRLVSP